MCRILHVLEGSGRQHVSYLSCLEGSGRLNLSYFTCLEVQNVDTIISFARFLDGRLWEGKSCKINNILRVWKAPGGSKCCILRAWKLKTSMNT